MKEQKGSDTMGHLASYYKIKLRTNSAVDFKRTRRTFARIRHLSFGEFFSVVDVTSKDALILQSFMNFAQTKR